MQPIATAGDPMVWPWVCISHNGHETFKVEVTRRRYGGEDKVSFESDALGLRLLAHALLDALAYREKQ